MRGTLVAFAALVTRPMTASHGTLTHPMSRALRFADGGADSAQSEALAGNCNAGACEWYQQKTVCPGAATNCDPAFRTMGVHCGSASPSDYPCTPGHAVPWCAPGTAPVSSPCGVFAGAGPLLQGGRDMLDLQGPPSETWQAGSVQRVGWSMVANHGGGYAFRLALRKPAAEMTEKMFEKGHLAFASETTAIVNASGDTVTTFPAARLSNGTHPPGSTWSRNPIPLETGMITPVPGLPELSGRGPFPFSVVDQVHVPAELAAGEYVLSWRWDAEQTKQVWSQCADVRIVASATAAAAATSAEPEPPPASASAARVVCSGASLGLTMDECSAWVEIYDALNGPGWVGTNDTRVYAARTDPCGATWTDWRKSIVCTQNRDLKHISEVYLMGVSSAGSMSEDLESSAMIDVRGVLPASIGQLHHLVALSIVSSGLTGEIPPSLGDIPNLKMIWLGESK